MPKNIVLCCNSTANEFAQNRTNVIKLSYTLQHSAEQQILYYHPELVRLPVRSPRSRER